MRRSEKPSRFAPACCIVLVMNGAEGLLVVRVDSIDPLTDPNVGIQFLEISVIARVRMLFRNLPRQPIG